MHPKEIMMSDVEEIFNNALMKVDSQFFTLNKIARIQGLKKIFEFDCDFTILLVTEKHIIIFKKGNG